jgi:hypothetical protein
MWAINRLNKVKEKDNLENWRFASIISDTYKDRSVHEMEVKSTALYNCSCM